MIKITSSIMFIYKWIILAIALWNIATASTKNEECEKIQHYIKGIFWVLWAIVITK